MSTVFRGAAVAYWRGMENRRSFVAVVDDEESVRRALLRLLRAANLDAEAFASGEAFLESLDKFRPDCVVLDLQMPEMNGLELQLRLAERGIRLPVVVITGHDEPGMRVQCMAAGASTYLRKPLDDKVLLEAINKAIATGRCND